MSKIKVGIVNYLNTAPLVYGLQRGEIAGEIDLVGDYPSNLARDLKEGKIDLGLVPVAVIPELNEWHLVGNYCIGSDGPVASVCIFSDVPIEEARTVLLDYQSKTSVALARLLLRDYWKVTPKLEEATDGFEDKITDQVAALVIGDRAFEQRSRSKYAYDLGEAWKKFTGLPFVYAAWVSNRRLDDHFVARFDAANKLGLSRLEEVIAEHSSVHFNLGTYYRKHISYPLDEAKKTGLRAFLDLIPSLRLGR